MMLKTGNRGFTFLEVMVAAAVLALGTVLIYEAFFISLNSYNYYVDYLNVASWANDKIWQAELKLLQAGSASTQEAGEFRENNKVFSWNLNYGLLDEQTGLYSIDLFLSWKTGKREFVLSRNTYCMLQQK
jgi:prepilin-type N-terminal cleavage/methylation domain-containing protein